MDARWQQLGDTLVNYSTGLQMGERVMIAMSEVESYPLAHAVYQAAIQAGAYPQVQFLSEGLRHSVLQHSNRDQLIWLPEIEAYGMEWADVYIGLRGAYDLNLHADIPAERLSLNQAAMGRISTLRWQKTRWCLVRLPNAALARQAAYDEATITDMFFQAALVSTQPQAATHWLVRDLFKLTAEASASHLSSYPRFWIGQPNAPSGNSGPQRYRTQNRCALSVARPTSPFPSAAGAGWWVTVNSTCRMGKSPLRRTPKALRGRSTLSSLGCWAVA
jgi:hypothetical protein